MENTVMSLVTIVAVMLIFVYMVLAKTMHLDMYKDRLFQIREQWFDLALDEDSSHQVRLSHLSACGMAPV